jgi:hypothetical protein
MFSQGGQAQKVAEAAEAYGRAAGTQLELRVTGCHISRCGQFGMSIDPGATASISSCWFEANDPYSFFVKGGCDVCVTGCSFVYSGRSAKSRWAQAAGGGGGKALNCSGGCWGSRAVGWTGLIALAGWQSSQAIAITIQHDYAKLTFQLQGGLYRQQHMEGASGTAGTAAT